MVDQNGTKTDLAPVLSYTASWSSDMSGGNTGSGWFGPLAPMLPTAPPDVRGRQFDLRPGINLVINPRQTESISFEMLRHLADSYDLLRLIIETRKDQIDRIDFTFRSKKGKTVPQARIDAVQKFFDRPDGEHTFRSWLRMLLEDLLVIDAPTLYRLRDRGGSLMALLPMDGATIKRVVDDWGRTPYPYTDESGQLQVPPAYQQILKGMPAVDYSVYDLRYMARNIRTHKIYGYSPVEQIIMTVNIALRRELGTLDYYTEGNIPSALIGVPDNWTPDQIKQFQDYWDLYFSGDMAARRKAKFVPGGVAKTFIQTKEPELKNVFDEWLAKICCYAFAVSPQALVSQTNRATANTQKEQAEEEGLYPILLWLKDNINEIITVDLGEPDIEISIGDDEQVDPAQQATILTSYVNNAILTRNEAREKLGMNPLPEPEADTAGFTTPTGFVYLDMKENMSVQQQQMDMQTDHDTAVAAAAPAPVMGEKSLGSKGSQGSQGVKGKAAPRSKATEKSDDADDLEKAGYNPDEPRDQHGEWTSTPGANQTRNKHGQFQPIDGPTRRERRKKFKAETADKTVIRDKMGRFAGGRVSRDRKIQIGTKVATKVSIAAGITAASYAASLVLNKFPVLKEIVVTTMNALARSVLTEAVDMSLTLGFRDFFGMDAEGSKKFGRAGRTIIFGAWESTAKNTARQKVEEKVNATEPVVTPAQRLATAPKPKKVSTPKTKKYDDADDLLKGTDDLSHQVVGGEVMTSDESALLHILMAYAVPQVISRAFDQATAQLEEHGVDQKTVDMCDEYLHSRLADMTEQLQEMEKSESDGDLEKIGYTDSGPVPLDRPVTRRSRSSVQQKVQSALSKCGSVVTQHIMSTLSAEKMEKADSTAASVASSADLSAMRQIRIGQDLSNVSADAVYRTLVKIGVGTDQNLLQKSSSAVEDLSQKHSSAILGEGDQEDYSLVSSTRDMIERTVQSGLDLGQTPDEIAKRVQDTVFGEQRASDIADYEVDSASSMGTLQALMDAEESGLRVGKSWLTADDSRVDEDICRVNEDQGVIPVSEKFQSGHMAPLGHNRCRCALVPHVMDDETDDQPDDETDDESSDESDDDSSDDTDAEKSESSLPLTKYDTDDVVDEILSIISDGIDETSAEKIFNPDEARGFGGKWISGGASSKVLTYLTEKFVEGMAENTYPDAQEIATNIATSVAKDAAGAVFKKAVGKNLGELIASEMAKNPDLTSRGLALQVIKTSREAVGNALADSLSEAGGVEGAAAKGAVRSVVGGILRAIVRSRL